jgi:hypothetical protein
MQEDQYFKTLISTILKKIKQHEHQKVFPPVMFSFFPYYLEAAPAKLEKDKEDLEKVIQELEKKIR